MLSTEEMMLWICSVGEGNDSQVNGCVPTVLAFVDELGQRWIAWNRSDGFVMPPKPLAQWLDK